MVNLIIISLLRRLYRYSEETHTFSGAFMVKLVWILRTKHDKSKLPDNLCVKKYHSLHCVYTISVISTCYGDNIIFYKKTAENIPPILCLASKLNKDLYW